ncbi:MAG: AbrB/MazE/SpoVT family DNA-binding domain-containing protein [Anaerolineae bacterium]
MNISKVKLSSKNQMTLPKEARQALGVGAGDTLLVIIDGDEVKLSPLPPSLTDYMQGLGKELWAKLGGADEYLRRERESWQ